MFFLIIIIFKSAPVTKPQEDKFFISSCVITDLKTQTLLLAKEYYVFICL